MSRSGPVFHGHRGNASQAQSASSILVTRSMQDPRASGPGVLCCLDQFQETHHCRTSSSRQPGSLGLRHGLAVLTASAATKDGDF
jgi:hypothetical protein